jgi:hypothetical protein
MDESRSVSIDLPYSEFGVDITQALLTNKLPLSVATISERFSVLSILRKVFNRSLISKRIWRQLELGDDIRQLHFTSEDPTLPWEAFPSGDISSWSSG